jgi:hypothetical protein
LLKELILNYLYLEEQSTIGSYERKKSFRRIVACGEIMKEIIKELLY